MNYIALTSDLDWAPQEVLDYFLKIVDGYGIPVTIFMTNKAQIANERHEVSIHPNFTTLNLDEHIANLLADFPKARGVRSHSLFFTERLRPIYSKHRINYQSNVMLYKQAGNHPVPVSRDTIELPLFWMDTFYLEMEDTPEFSLNEIDLDSPGLKVFDFHPIHVFLNTYSTNHYLTAKAHYQHPAALKEFQNTSRRGIKDFLIELLERIEKNHSRVKTLSQICDTYRQSKSSAHT